MTIPELMVKVWDGDPDERFRHMDMNRICHNMNLIAEGCGVKGAQFPEVYRADQFRYDYAQIIEEMTAECAEALGLSLSTDTTWGPGRVLSHVDFERWESNCWELYRALGGTGERISAGKSKVTYFQTLFSGAWQGRGPYTQEFTMPSVHGDREAVAFVSHNATQEQRMAERLALLRIETVSDRRVRVTAFGLRPRVNIPMELSMRGFQMIENKTLTASGWTGTGPWYQGITLSNAVSDAVIGPTEGMTDAQFLAFADAGISASGVSGTTVTLRAMFEKPTTDMPVGVMYNEDDVI